MTRGEKSAAMQALRATAEVVRSWNPEEPDPVVVLCEQSRHRTLARLRACQEQWLLAARAFQDKNAPSVTILHPWRKFEAEGYARLNWEAHLARFLEDRHAWLRLLSEADWSRGGKMNRRPETIGGLARRLAAHEAHHLELLKRTY